MDAPLPLPTVSSRAPIALFVYNRPEHTRRTVEALAANEGAAASPLFIFSDAPRTPAAAPLVDQVRAYVRTVTGFAQVTVVERSANMGLARSIIEGVSDLTGRFGRAIVLEDDLATAPGFLSFMNDALDAYANDPRVLSVCGYMYPVVFDTPADTLFLRAPHSWGWATWKDRWSLFRPDGATLLQELEARRLLHAFDSNGPHDYTRMLKDQVAGRNDSWFVRWYAASLLADRVSLYPARSLVSNIGIDGTGVHCADWRFDPFKVSLCDKAVRVVAQEAAINERLEVALARYYRKVGLLRYVNFAYRLLDRMLPVPGRSEVRR
ncbi:glycosyltransferase [Methyloversatilis discipulorum]|jgi:hypothetical protein|uniref:glycosyltransferase n=1 Tax=Methyloversatilis discipulorum TaxID=1119528 RepID=UPI0003A7D073|nr:glycosyltransferase [Methyloversatilis discipulorum]